MKTMENRFGIVRFITPSKNGNTNCDFCTNCKDCHDCINCTDCTDCWNCEGCTDCWGCDNCVNCTGLNGKIGWIDNKPPI